jgi:arginyl-tRNA synthetase
MLKQIKNILSQDLTRAISLSASEILNLLEIPKNQDHGHFAVPVFVLAKILKKSPNEVALEIADLIQKNCDKNLILSASAIAGFVNVKLSAKFLQASLFEALADERAPIGWNLNYKNQKILVDFSSPNIAKPMHIGHFRATIVGESLRRLAIAHGAEVIGINHIGDWGTQFGKLAWAYMNWGSEYDFVEQPIDSLVALYVRFHDEAEKNPELNQFGAEVFLKLEKGDSEIKKIWQFIVECSFVEYNKIYKLLNIKHDLVLGESFYNDKMKNVVQQLEAKKLLSESEGAQVVFFPENEKIPPCLIKKSDGASIYATRDLAAAIYRKQIQDADQILYVVGVDQALHFKQVFRVLEMMGFEWAKDCHHISFGQYRFKEGKMSSRKGKTVLAEDVLQQAIEKAALAIEEKNSDLVDKTNIAQQIAIGAVVFGDLLTDRAKNVEFDLDRLLNTEGDSGPYVQYTHVRCLSLMRKYNQPIGFVQNDMELSLEEQKLIFTLLQLDHVIESAYRIYKPSLMAQYLLEVCSKFSAFYHKQRVLGEPAEVEKARMSLVAATARVLKSGLDLLNVPAPEVM